MFQDMYYILTQKQIVAEKNKEHVGGMNKNRGTLVLRLGAWKLTGFRGAAMVVLKQ